MPAVLFSYRAENIGGNNLNGLEPLFDKLRSVALDPLISLNAESAYTTEGVIVHSLVPDSQPVPAGTRKVNEVGLVLNRMNRSFRFQDMPEGTEQTMPPILNENAMRSLAFRKQRVWDEVFAPLGMGIPTRLVDTDAAVQEFVQQNPAGEYISKSQHGTGTTDTVDLLRHASHEVLAGTAIALEGKRVIQPAYDFSLPFPKGLRPYDADSREAFEGWGQSSAQKELRVYGFHSPLMTTTFPVGRAIQDNTDHWFFIDPESVPESVMEQSRAAIIKAAEVSGSRAVIATVDSGYGAMPGNDPAFHAIELNGKAPYIIGYDKHAGIADSLRTMLSQQIRQTIDEGIA